MRGILCLWVRDGGRVVGYQRGEMGLRFDVLVETFGCGGAEGLEMSSVSSSVRSVKRSIKCWGCSPRLCVCVCGARRVCTIRVTAWETRWKINCHANARTDNAIILPQLQVVSKTLETVPVGFAAAIVGQVLDVETFVDEVVVEDGIGFVVVAREPDFGRASGVVLMSLRSLNVVRARRNDTC